MENSAIFFTMVLLLMKTNVSSSNKPSTVITNGPQNTTVCMNATAECNCGFTGANPNHVIPNWRIIFRSDNGDTSSNTVHDGLDVAHGHVNGLQWVADLTGGNNNALNSKLLVGPVNKTHNQSSYQCYIPTIYGAVTSSMGTMTVADPPTVVINVDEICTTSITISLNTHSHPACGDVSHNVTISGNVILYPDTIGGSKYTIYELQSDTLYDIMVTSTYKTGSKTITQSVRTNPSKSPNSIDGESIRVKITNNNDVKMVWEPPLIDICTMSTIKTYNVQINSSEGEMISAETNNTTFFHEHLDCHTITALTVSIRVVNSEGLHSDPIMKTVVIQKNRTVNALPTTDSEVITNGNTEEHSELFMILSVVFLITSVIMTIICIVLSWKLCCQARRKEDAAPIPPTQVIRQLNVDDIVMQPSPAYAQSYQNASIK